MKNTKYISILILVLSVSATAQAQSLSSIPGSFVDVGFGTRPVGMGFAYVGLADDENAPYWNPAGLGHIQEITAGFSQIDQMGLITYNYASGIMPLPGLKHSVGLSVISSGDDALKELSAHLAYGIKLNIVNVGLALKYRNASFGNNNLNRDDYLVFDDAEIDAGFAQQVYGDANGFGADFGVMVNPTKELRFGLLIRDFIAPMNWSSQARGADYQAKGDYSEGLPMEIIVGSSYKINENFLAAVDFQPATDSERTNFVRVGVEGRLVNVLMLRAGTEQGVNDLDDEKYTLGTGLDIKLKDKIRIKTDFAYVIEPIQNSQRISFTISL